MSLAEQVKAVHEALPGATDEEMSDMLDALKLLNEAIPAESTERRKRYLAMAAKFGHPVSGTSGKTGTRTGGGGSVAAKYANPDPPHETWSGRGVMPRWMGEAIRRGVYPDKENYLIAGGAAHKGKAKPADESEEDSDAQQAAQQAA
jgi:DNA-binding protein H-NS